MRNTMKTLAILAVLLYSTSLLGQKENWDVYLAQYEKGPGSTVLNMSLKDFSNKRDFPFLLSIGVTFKDCDKDGFPSKEQFSLLYIISDSIKSSISRQHVNILAGTFTYQCKRTDYYYLKDTSNIRQTLLSLNHNSFKQWTFKLNIKKDQTWDNYLNALYPNDETLEFMLNSKVVGKLVEKGDKLEKPRQIDHWIYFNNEDDRNCFIEYAKRERFKIESKDKIDNKTSPYSLHISREDNAILSNISKVTLSLRQNAKKCHGDYDGWEAFLVTN